MTTQGRWVENVGSSLSITHHDHVLRIAHGNVQIAQHALFAAALPEHAPRGPRPHSHCPATSQSTDSGPPPRGSWRIRFSSTKTLGGAGQISRHGGLELADRRRQPRGNG